MKSIDITSLYAQYGKKTAGSLAPDDQHALKKGLDSIEKITSADEAYRFLQLLALLRQAEVKSIDGLGDSAMATITGAFAGGDEGVYAADTDLMNARFIFELVQNVDDCKYLDVNNCTLKIQFDIENDTIRLEYNELGFQPENVIAITGLGNSTKNHRKAKNLKAEKEIDQGDLQEIGEKGIGFKSIFGLAKKVKITSHYFCFTIDRNNFFVPIVEDYSNFSFSSSTVLELTLDDGMVDELYGFLKRKYDNVNAIINENPILFLNKLTEICYYRSTSDYFGFKVSRSNETGEYPEDDTIIEFYSSDRRKNKSIEALRFTHNIEYTVDECRARYGEYEETPRKHKVIVIAPKKADMIRVGRIYSFFATSEEINAPFIIHAPFKLNSGRTRIDSQSQGVYSRNKWFLRTQKETVSMIHHVYERLAMIQGNQIRYYIPDNSLVGYGCAISCVDLQKSNILTWNIFESVDGMHYPASQVCMLSFLTEQKNLIEIHGLLGIRKHLLKIEAREIAYFRNFMIEEILEVRDKLLKKALTDENAATNCLKYVNDYEPQFTVRNLTGAGISLSFIQLSELSKFERITQWINKQTFDHISPGKVGAKIDCSFNGPSKDVSVIKLFCDEYGEAINKQFVSYINRIKYFDLGFENTVYTYNAVLGKNMLEDFAEAYHILEPKDKFFYPFLRIEAVSEEIDRLCESGDSISDFEFLKNLGMHRTNQKNMLKNQYGSILDLIEKAGTGTERFFPEILQNIDDCLYRKSPYTVIRSDCVDGVYKLYVDYNEDGFSREQIRAITAIGDSTKKKLLSANTTGEKGVGFKSVFALCSSVSIKSGSFCFRLSADKPTVPEYIKEIEPYQGTQMIFTLKPVHAKTVLSILSDENKIIKYCLCMKQMHHLLINQKELQITDKDRRRMIKFAGREYTYFLYEYPIKVNNYLAMHQRSQNKDVLSTQVISFLIPLYEYVGEYCVYSTFPTQETVNIPMQINMPLELDTARERIQDGEWNKEIIHQMLDGLPFVYEAIKLIFKEKLPQFFPYNGLVLSHKYGHSSALNAKIIDGKFFKLAFKNEFVSLRYGIFSRDFEYSIFNQYARLINGDMPSKLLAKDEANFAKLVCLFPDYIKERTFDEICVSINSLLLTSKQQGNELIAKKEFREALYHFLADSRDKNNKQAHLIRKWEIIPIRFQKHTKYEAFDEEIYAPGENNIDSEKYKILDKQIMSAQVFDSIYANISNVYRNIRTFTKDIIIAEFFKEICSFVEQESLPKRAETVLKLFEREKVLFKETFNARKDFPTEKIVFVTRTGDTRDKTGCYLCKDKSNQGCLEQIIVREDYIELAELIGLSQLSEISSYSQIPFVIGRKELKELQKNKNLTQRTEVFNSLYLYPGKANELTEGLGFFELYTLVSTKVKYGKNQPSMRITVDDDVLKTYSELINEISLNDVPISFSISAVLSEFEKDNILSEIEDELQLRKETDKTRRIIGMLANCNYAKLMRREPCCIRGNNGCSLLIDSRITADYDIIEALKAYFLKYFNTELSVNRNIRLYNRRGFENISTIDSSDADVASAVGMMNGVNMLNVEDVKDFICRPLTVNGVTFGGYAKTCPLCDSRVNTELTGMRIYKTKCAGTIIPLISCSNCHDSLRYSSSIDIDVEKIQAGLLDMRCQINGYEWVVKDKVIRLGHRALIRRVNKE